MLSFAGTPYWMAPEVIQEPSEATSACDIWSLGCTVIELMTGKPPYFDLNPWAAMTNIVREERPEFPADISPEMSDFLNCCFQKDPKKRTDASTLLRHKLLNKVDKEELEMFISGNGQDTLNLPKELTSTLKKHLDRCDGGYYRQYYDEDSNEGHQEPADANNHSFHPTNYN